MKRDTLISRLRGTACAHGAALFAFVSVFLASLVRFFAYGFTYYPLLDDFIQYFNYPSSQDYALLIEREGFLASRPLAGLGDLFFWSRFRGNLAAALLLIALLWTLSALLWHRLFCRCFGGSGWIFLAVYALLPLNFEGTYWLSASTRTVCGLFFCALSLTLFWRVLRLPLASVRGVLRLFAFALTLCLSYCFYEQILVLSLAAVLLFSFAAALQKNKKALWGLLSLAAAAGYFLFTSAHHAGALTSRMELILPDTPYYFKVFLPELLTQLRRVFCSGGLFTLLRGIPRGVEVIFSDRLLLPSLMLVGTAALWFFGASAGTAASERTPAARSGPPNRKDRSAALFFERHPFAGGILFAVLLTAAPLAPYFIIANPWVSFRAAVPALPGIALGCDLLFGALVRRLPDRHRCRRILTGAAAACLCLLFCLGSLSELHDYRAASLRDGRIADAILSYLDNPGNDGAAQTLTAESRLGILNLAPADRTAQNYFYHEHVIGSVENVPSLNNLLLSRRSPGVVIPEIVPLDLTGCDTNRGPETDAEGRPLYYKAWNAGAKRPDGFALLLWYDEETNTLTPVRAVPMPAGWRITDGERDLAVIVENADGTAGLTLLR